MRLEICITCIDDGLVPRHRIFNWEIKGNASRDVRMKLVEKVVIEKLKEEFGSRKNPKKVMAKK